MQLAKNCILPVLKLFVLQLFLFTTSLLYFIFGKKFYHNQEYYSNSSSDSSLLSPPIRTRIPLISTSSIGITRHLRPSMILVSTSSTLSGSTWITTSGVLISNLRVLVILEATMVAFSPATASYWLSKSFQFLVFYTAVLKETFHLRLSEHNRVWGIFLCFNDLVQFLMDSNNGVILAVVTKGFLHQSMLKESRCPPAESGAVQPNTSSTKNIVKLLCILRIVEHAVDVCASVIK